MRGVGCAFGRMSAKVQCRMRRDRFWQRMRKRKRRCFGRCSVHESWGSVNLLTTGNTISSRNLCMRLNGPSPSLNITQSLLACQICIFLETPGKFCHKMQKMLLSLRKRRTHAPRFERALPKAVIAGVKGERCTM